MPSDKLPREGSLIVAALIVLALVFAGHWIVSYVEEDTNPWALAPWYGIAAVLIVAFGFYRNLGRGGGRGGS